jgi:hypothetical protein
LYGYIYHETWLSSLQINHLVPLLFGNTCRSSLWCEYCSCFPFVAFKWANVCFTSCLGTDRWLPGVHQLSETLAARLNYCPVNWHRYGKPPKHVDMADPCISWFIIPFLSLFNMLHIILEHIISVESITVIPESNVLWICNLTAVSHCYREMIIYHNPIVYNNPSIEKT